MDSDNEDDSYFDENDDNDIQNLSNPNTKSNEALSHDTEHLQEEESSVVNTNTNTNTNTGTNQNVLNLNTGSPNNYTISNERA